MAQPASMQVSDEVMIKLEAVNKWYGQFHVLKNINLTVNKGERIVIDGTPFSSVLCAFGEQLRSIRTAVQLLPPRLGGKVQIAGVGVGRCRPRRWRPRTPCRRGRGR